MLHVHVHVHVPRHDLSVESSKIGHSFLSNTPLQEGGREGWENTKRKCSQFCLSFSPADHPSASVCVRERERESLGLMSHTSHALLLTV